MIKCISYWSTRHGLSNTEPIGQALTTAKSAGFRGMELCVAPEGEITPDMSEKRATEIRHLIDQSEMVVETLASGMSWGCNPTSNDREERAKSIELHKGALRTAARLGCEGMLFVPGIVTSPISPGVTIRYDHAVDRAREAVNQLLEVAEEVGVNLCVENVWNGLFYSPLEFREFVDSFGSDRLGVYFDVGNVLGYHQYPPHWIDLLGPRIKRVHIKDYTSTFASPGSFNFCDLLEGQVPWQETMEALHRIGYRRTVVAEMMPWREDLLDVTSAAMDRILAMNGASGASN